MLILFTFITINVRAQERIYILFKNDSKNAQMRIENTKEKNILIDFDIKKRSPDCPYAFFYFFKYSSDSSIVNVHVDKLTNVISSEWIMNQLDTTLIKIFDKKQIYVSPTDSIRQGIGKAYLVGYKYCEKI